MVAEKVSLCSRPAVTLTIRRIDRQPGHALGRIDGQPDRLLGPVEIDDDAGFDALRFLVADADHLEPGACGRAAAGRPRAASACATMQQTLLEPTSSTVTMPERRGEAIAVAAKPAHIFVSGLRFGSSAFP